MKKKDASWLPSGKFVLLTALIIIIIALIMFFSNRSPETLVIEEEDTLQTEGELIAARNEQAAQSDSDGDGVPDWEELLWNTDPFSKDTDGNGITDDREIRQQRAEQEAGLPENYQETVDAQEETATAQFARGLYTTVASIDDSTTSLTIPEIAETVVEQIEGFAEAEVEYRTSDLTIEEVGKLAYAQDFNAVFLTYPLSIDIMRDIFQRVVEQEELPKKVSFFNPVVFNPGGQVVGRANGLPDIMRMYVRNDEFVFCPCKPDPLGVVVLLGTKNQQACGIIGRR